MQAFEIGFPPVPEFEPELLPDPYRGAEDAGQDEDQQAGANMCLVEIVAFIFRRGLWI